MVIFQSLALWQDTATQVVPTHPLFSLRSLHLELPGSGQEDLPQGTCPSLLVSSIACFHCSVSRGCCDAIWVIPAPDSRWRFLWLLSQGFSVTSLLAGDHLLQLGLLAFENKAIPAAIGFNTRKSCCSLRQPVTFPDLKGNMGISLPPQGPNPQDRFPGTGSWTAKSEAAPSLYGDVPCECCASSQAFPCLCPCQSAQGPKLMPSHRVLQML